MEVAGFGPAALALRRQCSTWLSYTPKSGEAGTRTPGLCNAIAALYQLSYNPMPGGENCRIPTDWPDNGGRDHPWQDLWPPALLRCLHAIVESSRARHVHQPSLSGVPVVLRRDGGTRTRNSPGFGDQGSVPIELHPYAVCLGTKKPPFPGSPSAGGLDSSPVIYPVPAPFRAPEGCGHACAYSRRLSVLSICHMRVTGVRLPIRGSLLACYPE